MSEQQFEARFGQLFRTNYERLYRYLNRMSNDADLAADLAQETFVRLFRRGALPDRPEAWLITVALNLFRNTKASNQRRSRLLTQSRGRRLLSDDPLPSDEAADASAIRVRVRAALEKMQQQSRQLLLLRAEGYSYSDIAAALELNEASIGTLLARAKLAFRQHYEGADAPGIGTDRTIAPRRGG